MEREEISLSMRGVIRKGISRRKLLGTEESGPKEKEIVKKAELEMAQMVDLRDQDTGSLSHHQIIIATTGGTIHDHLPLLLAPEHVMRMKNLEELNSEMTLVMH